MLKILLRDGVLWPHEGMFEGMASPIQSTGVRPSPIFFGLLALVGLAAYLCTASFVPSELAVFIFVVSGWILSLVFHEFAHAYTAYKGGDRSVASKGYLTLDPRKYADPLTSLLLPCLFILMGGIALPGGAVWINRGAIRSRTTESLMSLAGPFSNLAFGVALIYSVSVLGLAASQPVLAGAISLLAYFQILAFVLNMLPVPGLDGYGAIEPHLSHELRAQIQPYRQYGIWIMIGALFFIPPVRDVFFDMVENVGSFVGLDLTLRAFGSSQFFFWL